MKKICILGYADSMFQAPYHNPEWEIWGLNKPFRPICRFDKWFELHNPEYIMTSIRNATMIGHVEDITDVRKKYKYAEMLFNKQEDVFVCEPVHWLPKAKIFPRQEIQDFIQSEFFTNSIAWMIAYALYLGAKTIGLWGVDMATKQEYLDQRASVIYMLGIAKGMGVEIMLPPQCKLFNVEKKYWNL